MCIRDRFVNTYKFKNEKTERLRLNMKHMYLMICGFYASEEGRTTERKVFYCHLQAVINPINKLSIIIACDSNAKVSSLPIYT